LRRAWRHDAADIAELERTIRELETSPLFTKKITGRAFLIDVPRSKLRVSDMRAATWIRRIGFWGFLFFLVKGLLWLIVPALVAFWAAN
jgi:hypothetical protein